MTQPLKRVGRRIVQVCEIVDRLGVGGSSEVYQYLPMDKHNISMYLRRAVGLGLMVADRTTKAHQFRLVNGWREMLPRPKVRPEPVRIDVVPMLSVAMLAQSRAFPLSGVWA
jgi:hypothetical protein